MSLAELFEGQRVVVAHAHPDDEVLATGVLLAWLADRGVPTWVVTSTRGERGEIVAGALPAGTTPEDLVRARQAECLAALAEIGDLGHHWLGTPPARVDGAETRVYRDSGMRWVTPTLAGPDDSTDERTLTAASVDDAAADLAAFARSVGATLVVSYDADGGYGHPDHVRTHEVAKEAARRAGVGFAEFASDLDDPRFERHDLPQYLDDVVRALRHYRSQLTVHPDGIEHVGGQRQEFPVSVALRRV